MSHAIQKLTQLITHLERSGDELRLYAAQSAYHFRHSWLEMANALVEVRKARAFERWGYDSFLAYCDGELGLKKAIVDKLTVSFHTLEQYAPERLGEGAEEPIPSYQSLDYFARAMGEPRYDGSDPRDAPADPLSPELTGQLRAAVFDECCTPKQLRDRFEPLIRPKSDDKVAHEAVKRVLSTTRRLQEQLEEIPSLDVDLLRDAVDVLSRLRTAMEAQDEHLRGLQEA